MRAAGVLFLLAAACLADDRADFDKALAHARKLTKFSKWKACRTSLVELLNEHQGENYVRARRNEIADLMKQCVFRAELGVVDPKTLISGTLVKYNARTGKIKLTYESHQLRDFKTHGDFRVHDAAFAGPHRITISGVRYPDGGGLQFLVCDAGVRALRVSCGYNRSFTVFTSARVTMIEGGKEHDLDKSRYNPCMVGKPFSIRLDVGKRDFRALQGKSPFLLADKDKEHWGRFGFLGSNIERIEMEGLIEKSWIQGLIDKETQRRLAEFERTYRAAEYLPGWLFEKATTSQVLAKPEPREWPGEMDEATLAFAKDCLRLHSTGQCEAGLERASQAEGISVATAHYWRARFLEALGRYAEALGEIEKVCELDSGYVRAREHRAVLLARAGRPGDGLKEYEALIAEYPGGARLHADAALFVLRHGEPARAKQILDDAVARGVTSKYLRETSRIVGKAVLGPAWPRKYEFKSRNYEIVSDIDVKTCVEASKVLEASYAAYVVRLERAKDLEKRRFRVYLFSGESGYTKYCKDLWGSSMSHSAGMYDPTLKQLLIWNLPQRDQMMKTVRHEGFHQYLDRIMSNPPIWFNEGLAEYYETARVVGGTWQLGVPRTDHLFVLSKGVMPLRSFLQRGATEFMKQASKHYAQSWAFIRFLRHSTQENAALFERLWEAFKRIPNHAAAVKHALAGRDLGQIEKQFRDHLTGLMR